ncbi:MAG: four helix bundle protein [Sedimentisphaerales bacterium]|nr:four helix bundle protein [Sedimentisphaerales bacterium]
MSRKIDITERTFKFALEIIKLSNKLGNDSSSGRILSNQLLRAGTSIGANIEEAQAAESKADFIHKYKIALKEARETKYWLRLLPASDIVTKINLDSFIKESDEICKIIAQITINARNNK